MSSISPDHSKLVQSLLLYQDHCRCSMMVVVMTDIEENQISEALKEQNSEGIEVSHLLKFTQRSTMPGALPSSTHVVLTEHIEGVHIQAFKQLLEKRFDHVINLEYLERLAQSHNEREELSQPEFSAQSRSYRKRI